MADEDETWRFMNRRLIYFNRLITDDSFSKRQVHRRDSGIHACLAFLYATMFCVIITNRSPVFTRYDVNQSILTSLKNKPYQSGPPRGYFSDIEDAKDVLDWLGNTVLTQVLEGPPVGREFALNWNEILPMYYSAGYENCKASSTNQHSKDYNPIQCANFINGQFRVPEDIDPLKIPNSLGSSIRLTVRKPKLIPTDNKVTSELFPFVWSQFELGVDADPKNEDTKNITGTYKFDGYKLDVQSTETLANLDDKFSSIGRDFQNVGIKNWDALDIGDDIRVTWNYFPKQINTENGVKNADEGYMNDGGYVAVMNLELTPEMKVLKQQMLQTGDTSTIREGIVDKQGINLLTPKELHPYQHFGGGKEAGNSKVNSSISSNRNQKLLPPHSNRMSFKSFKESGLLKGAGVLIVDFLTYNTKLNSLSYITTRFRWNAAGNLSEKRIDVNTILLDPQSEWLDILDLIFLISTILYLIAFVQKTNSLYFRSSCKGFFSEYISDYWNAIELAGLISAILTVIFWSIYSMELEDLCNNIVGKSYAIGLTIDPNATGSKMNIPFTNILPQNQEGKKITCKDVRIDNYDSPPFKPDITPQKLINMLDTLRQYDVVSGITCLLLFCRIVKTMKNAFQRVELLEYTLRLAFPPILNYFLFTGVIFFAFVNAGALLFVSSDISFENHGTTVITLFLMFLGRYDRFHPDVERPGGGKDGNPSGVYNVVDSLDNKDAATSTVWNLYFMPFMLLFYFVNLQMLNAIINFAYNKANVDLSARFEQEKLANRAIQHAKKALKDAQNKKKEALRGSGAVGAVVGMSKSIGEFAAVKSVAGEKFKALTTDAAGAASGGGGEIGGGNTTISNNIKEGIIQETGGGGGFATTGSSAFAAGGAFAKKKKKTTKKVNEIDGMEAVQLMSQRPQYDHVRMELVEGELREKVYTFLNKGKELRPGDGLSDIMLYLVFAVCYIYFVGSFVQVPNSYALKSSIKRSINETPFPMKFADGTQISRSYDEIATLSDVPEWLEKGLHRALFSNADDQFEYNPSIATKNSFSDIIDEELLADSNKRLIPSFGLNDVRNAYCLSGWNCLIKSDFGLAVLRVYENERNTIATAKYDTNAWSKLTNDPNSLISIKNRRRKSDINQGPLYCNYEELEQAELWFFNPTTNENSLRDSYFTSNGNPKGVYECVLLTEKTRNQEQLSELMRQELIFINTTKVELIFGTYNGHSDTLVYSKYDFIVQASGMINTEITSIPFQLFATLKDSTAGAVSIAAGGIYVLLVLYFAFVEIMDIKQDCAKKQLLEGKSTALGIAEHFTEDLFNLLDLTSILISLIAMVFYINFVIATYDLKENYERLTCFDSPTDPTKRYSSEKMECKEIPPGLSNPPYDSLPISMKNTIFPDTMTSMGNIAAASITYIRISAVNTLVIALRVLKFFRDSPRMNKLNTTLYHSILDIAWLIAIITTVLFGFVGFGHRVFGSQIYQLTTFLRSTFYSLYFVCGNVEYFRLANVDPIMTPFFVFPMLIAFVFIGLNIFFAVLDRVFITHVSEGDPVPALNIKKKLKPYLGKVVTWIEWDEDAEMLPDRNAPQKPKPPSRKKVVEDTKREVERILAKVHTPGVEMGSEAKHLLGKSDEDITEGVNVKDVLPERYHDDRIEEVVQWSTETARQFITQYHTKFMEGASVRGMGGLGMGSSSRAKERREQRLFASLDKDIADAKLQAEDLESNLKFNSGVYIRSQIQDQITLCNYIYAMQNRLAKLEHEKTELETLVGDLEEFNLHEEDALIAGGDLLSLANPNSPAKGDNRGDMHTPGRASSLGNSPRSARLGSARSVNGKGGAGTTMERISEKDNEDGSKKQEDRKDPTSILRVGDDINIDLDHKKQSRKDLSELLQKLNEAGAKDALMSKRGKR